MPKRPSVLSRLLFHSQSSEEPGADAGRENTSGQLWNSVEPVSWAPGCGQLLRSSPNRTSPDSPEPQRKTLWNEPSRRHTKSTGGQLSPPGTLEPGILLPMLSWPLQKAPHIPSQPRQVPLLLTSAHWCPQTSILGLFSLIASQTMCIKSQSALPHLKNLKKSLNCPPLNTR